MPSSATRLPSGMRTRYVNRIAEITAPTLFIHSEKDTLIPLAEIQSAVERMPDARLEVLENTGHWPPRGYLEEFNELVIGFWGEEARLSGSGLSKSAFWTAPALTDRLSLNHGQEEHPLGEGLRRA